MAGGFVSQKLGPGWALVAQPVFLLRRNNSSNLAK